MKIEIILLKYGAAKQTVKEFGKVIFVKFNL
jgi:hypothetical protein